MTTFENSMTAKIGKSIALLLSVSLLFIIMSACAQKPSAEQDAGGHTDIPTIADDGDSTEAEEEEETETRTETDNSAESTESLKEETDASSEETEPPAAEQTEQPMEDELMEQKHFYITANSITFTADFADSDSADALRELLGEGDLTINMSDYGGFEKVGSIGKLLSRKDTQISTTAGDIMLYQGSQIVIFYGTNSWSYSRLGRIEGADANDLLSAFGSGDVDITFSLTNPQ